MKGDFSRFSYDPQRHYTRVLMQQGRVQTDADWNEQADIIAHRHQTSLRDVIGRVGVPRDRPGFGIRGHGGLQFDGIGNYLEVRATRALRFAGDNYAVEGWIKVQPGKHGMTVVSRLNHEPRRELPGGFRFGITAHGQLRFERLAVRDERFADVVEIARDIWGDVIEIDLAIDVERIGYARVIGRHQLPVGRFCHVAAVCSDERLLLYVDGKLNGEQYGGTAAPFETLPMLIGCDHVRGRHTHYFAGVVDQLRIWRRALDEEQIRTIMQHGAAGASADDLAVSWRFSSQAAEREIADEGHHGHRIHAGGGSLDRMPKPADPELWIGAGHCYVDGVLCENIEDIRYDKQPDAPGLVLPDLRHCPGPYVAYLDSWDRVISANVDEAIREPALGGPDTAMRVRTICQVRLRPVSGDAEPTIPDANQGGSLRVTATPRVPLDDNLLYRIEIHDPGFAAGAPVPAHRSQISGIEVAAITAEHKTVTLAGGGGDRLWAAGQTVELLRPGLKAAIDATVESVEHHASGQVVLTLNHVPNDGSEPHAWWLRPIATFKWSRDNGAWAFAVTSLDADETRLRLADPNRIRSELHEQDWVELVDDDIVLSGAGGAIRQVKEIDEGDNLSFGLTVGQACVDPLNRPPGQRFSKHPELRRWDGIDAEVANAAGAKAISANKKIALDAGINIEFGTGVYASGDYWIVPIRGYPRWPADESGTALALPPQGIQHRYARLAFISYVNSTLEIEDLRPIFPPLVGGSASVTPAREAVVADEPDHLKEILAAPVETEAPIVPARESIDPGEAESPIDQAGLLPDRCMLSASAVPPLGWQFTGAQIIARQADPVWSELQLELPHAGPMLAAVVEDMIFCLWRSGDLWRLDLRDTTWAECRRLHHAPIRGASLAALDGKLHVVGGYDHEGVAASAHHHCYDPVGDEWRERAPLPTPRSLAATAVLNGMLFAIGGTKTPERDPLPVVEVYSHRDDAWTARPPLPHALCDAAAAASDGRLHVFGGLARHLFWPSRAQSAETYIFSPSAEQWMQAAPLLVARSGAQVVQFDDRLYVVGGRRADRRVAPVETFAPSTGRWLEAPQPKLLRTRSGVVALGGTLYVLGGVTADGPARSIESCRVEHIFNVHRQPDGKKPAD